MESVCVFSIAYMWTGCRAGRYMKHLLYIYLELFGVGTFRNGMFDSSLELLQTVIESITLKSFSNNKI